MSPSTNDLLPRERNVITALVAGHTSNRQLAQAMGLSQATVRDYISDAIHKIGCDNRTDLVLWALRNGWTLPEVNRDEA